MKYRGRPVALIEVERICRIRGAKRTLQKMMLHAGALVLLGAYLHWVLVQVFNLHGSPVQEGFLSAPLWWWLGKTAVDSVDPKAEASAAVDEVCSELEAKWDYEH